MQKLVPSNIWDEVRREIADAETSVRDVVKSETARFTAPLKVTATAGSALFTTRRLRCLIVATVWGMNTAA